MQCTRLIFFGKKACHCCHFKVKFKQTSIFLDFSKLFWMETDTQKSTKLHVQPSNRCSLKIYQPVYIDHMGCIALG